MTPPHLQARPIRGLTLRHPWAWCVTTLGKRTENRSWHPSKAGLQIGEYLAIHGGKFSPAPAYRQEILDAASWVAETVFSHDPAPYEALGILAGLQGEYGTPEFCRAVSPQGIVGVARLAGCLAPGTLTDDPWYTGDYGWLLEDFVPMKEPVPHRGAQGCWPLEPHALIEVRRQYRAARSTASPARNPS